MTIHHRIPSDDDIQLLTGDVDVAVTIYLPTSGDRRGQAKTAFKSALDGAAAQLPDPDGVLAQGAAVLADTDLWGALSRSLAVFLTPDSTDLYVLPNNLDEQVAVGSRFELGQFLRSVSQQQEALALTLSADAWQLWHAVPDSRIAPVEVPGDHPSDAGKATQRASAGREDDRLGGDPYDLYVKRVSDAVAPAIAAIDPENRLTLFVFGDERLIHLFSQRSDGRRIVGLAGNPDRVGPDELDATVRGLLDELNDSDTLEEISALKDGDPSAIERDLAAIARMAVKGGVDTYWFDFTSTVPGTLDATTGELAYADDAAARGANDLLARVAQLVHASGGRVVAVRGSDLGDAWNGPALARLRYSLS